jgi:hypothetical protein
VVYIFQCRYHVITPAEKCLSMCVNNTLDALRKMKVMLLEAADVAERLIRHLPLATLVLLDFISGHSVSLA